MLIKVALMFGNGTKGTIQLSSDVLRLQRNNRDIFLNFSESVGNLHGDRGSGVICHEEPESLHDY